MIIRADIISVPASTESSPKPSIEPLEASWDELGSLAAGCPQGENLSEQGQLVVFDNQVSGEIGK